MKIRLNTWDVGTWVGLGMKFLSTDEMVKEVGGLLIIFCTPLAFIVETAVYRMLRIKLKRKLGILK